jgi:hypothetical protein
MLDPTAGVFVGAARVCYTGGVGQDPLPRRSTVLKVIRYRNDEQGQRTEEVVDQFTVPFEVVEIRVSDNCEWEFVGTDGRVVSSVDIT